METLTLPLALVTSDDGPVLVPVDVTDAGVLVRGSGEPLDLVSLVLLLEDDVVV